MNYSLDNSVNACKNSTQEDVVLCKGLKWLFENPVDLVADGFLELGEELNLYYKLYLQSEDPKEKEFFKRYIFSRVEYLLEEHTLKVDFAGEITAYLNFAKIMKIIGIESSEYWKFITNDILTNPMTYPPNITYSILNTALIEDIGLPPRTPLKSIVSRGIIAHFANNPALIPVGKAYASSDNVMNFFYDVTHELFAVSSFGDRDPKQFLLPHEVEFLKDIIRKGISIYLKEEQVDILAELIVCAKMLEFTNFDGFEETIKFILSYQREDGSFGIIERMVFLGRPNVYRHGVLVSMWALIE